MTFIELPLSKVLSFHNGKKPPELVSAGYPVFGSNGPIGLTKAFNHENAVILGRVGAYCGSVEYCEGRFWASDNTIVVKPLDGFDAKYLYYSLKNQPLRSYAGGAAQPLITHGILKPIKAKYHGQGDQKRIANILSAYDDLIENNRRRIALLEEAARQLYKEWFVRFRFPGHEHVKIIDGVPEGWSNARVADLGLVVTGKTPSKRVEENFGSDIPFIKTPDMHGQTLIVSSEEWLSERGANSQLNKTLPTGSVLVSCIGTIGVVAMTTTPAQTNQQINAVIPRHARWQFFAYFILEAIRPQLEAMGGGVTMANVNKSKFEGVPIIIASNDLITGFDDRVRPMFDLIETLSRQNMCLAKARDLLLPKLMSGAITV